MTIQNRVVAAMTLSGLLAAVGPAAAQGDSVAPLGTFGGGGGGPQRHVVTLTAAVAEEQDDNTLLSGNILNAGAVPPGSNRYLSMSGTLAYVRKGQNTTLNLNGGSSFRYDQRQGGFLSVDRNVGGSFEATVGRSGRLTIGQGVSDSSSYLYRLFPALVSDVAIATIPDSSTAKYTGGEHRALSTNTSADFSHPVSRRGSIQLRSSLRRTSYREADDQLQWYSVGGGYQRTMTRNAKLRFDYAYRKGQYSLTSQPLDTVVHDLNIGVDYSRALSRSRRSFVSFRTGSSLVEGDRQKGGDPSQYSLQGDASFTHRMGRTWQAQLAYQRGLRFVEGFSQPVLSNGITTTVRGLAGSRLELTAGGGYSRGEPTRTPAGSDGFETYTAMGNARVAVSRHLAVYGEFVHYYYDLGSSFTAAHGLPAGLGQNSIRVGLTLWAPLVTR